MCTPSSLSTKRLAATGSGSGDIEPEEDAESYVEDEVRRKGRRGAERTDDSGAPLPFPRHVALRRYDSAMTPQKNLLLLPL